MSRPKACAAEGCDSSDVTARLVSIGYGAWCRLLLCDEHGRRHHPDIGTPFGRRQVAIG